MTWDEFKALIDNKLIENGANGSASITYIDIGTTDNPTVEVEVDNSDPQEPFTAFSVYG